MVSEYSLQRGVSWGEDKRGFCLVNIVKESNKIDSIIGYRVASHISDHFLAYLYQSLYLSLTFEKKIQPFFFLIKFYLHHSFTYSLYV